MNWPPAPGGRVILMVRRYWPQESGPAILVGSSGEAGWLKRQIADNLMLAD